MLKKLSKFKLAGAADMVEFVGAVEVIETVQAVETITVVGAEVRWLKLFEAV